VSAKGTLRQEYEQLYLPGIQTKVACMLGSHRTNCTVADIVSAVIEIQWSTFKLKLCFTKTQCSYLLPQCTYVAESEISVDIGLVVRASDHWRAPYLCTC
jgi:hypothetical protein